MIEEEPTANLETGEYIANGRAIKNLGAEYLQHLNHDHLSFYKDGEDDGREVPEVGSSDTESD